MRPSRGSFDHLSAVWFEVEKCYAANTTGLTPDSAHRLATRDVLLYWREQVAEIARALAPGPGRKHRLWYRTSAPGSERWLRGTSKLMRARSAAGFLSCDDVVAAADGVGVEYRHELFSAINDMSVAARAEPQTH